MNPPPTRRIACSLHVNDSRQEIETWDDASLLDALRGPLGLTGAKRGCDIGTCGTCTVLVEGVARKSCQIPLSEVIEGDQQVRTVEGMAAEDLHPLQQAFIDNAAVQCGFCTPGLLMSAAALVKKKPEPTEADVGRFLRAQLCRCTGYQQIVDAVLDGARRMRDGETPRPTASEGAIGSGWMRTDATDKVTGACAYTDDQPATLHGAVVRAGVPHGILRGIDATDAEAMDGVRAVLTAKDIPGEIHFGNAIADMPALCIDRVRFVGDAVAIVIADDPRVAAQAAELVRLDIELLPVVTDPRAAIAEDAPSIHPDGNLASHQRLRKGDAESALADAHTVVEGWYRTPFVEHACLETESAIAHIEGEDLIIEAPSQNVYFDRREVARVTGWDKKKVVIKQQPMGAAFGKREDLYCQHHAALATMAMGGRPVKITLSREDTFRVTTKRHPFVMHYRVGCDADGRIVGLAARVWADTGAYASWAPNILRKALVHGAGAYDIDNISIDAWSCYTNNGYAGAFRGFGAPQVFFGVERSIDELARAAGLDPIDIRRQNGLRLGGHTATGQELVASVGLPACLEAVSARLDRSHRGGTGRYRKGIGVAHAFYGIGYGNGIPDIGSAILELLEDGRVQLRISTVDYGQGSSTLFPQIVCEELGISREQVDLVTGDTSLCPDSGSTVASRQTYISGNAVLLACQKFTRKIRKAVTEATGEHEIPIANGRVGPLSWSEVAKLGNQKTQARFRARTSRLDPETGQGDAYWPYAFGAQGVEVTVDTKTGKVRIDRLIAAQDVGKALNPPLVEGQIRGAVAMGVGFALFEEYRVKDGIPLDLNFDTYRLPMYADMPNVDVVIIEEPEPTGPYGAKGVGEPPMVPTAPAIANAVADALGVSVTELPLTRERVLALIAG